MTSRNEANPNRPGVDINGERYWPVKVKHRSTGHTKWANLHKDEPTVRTFVLETIALENATKSNRLKRNPCENMLIRMRNPTVLLL